MFLEAMVRAMQSNGVLPLQNGGHPSSRSPGHPEGSNPTASHSGVIERNSSRARVLQANRESGRTSAEAEKLRPPSNSLRPPRSVTPATPPPRVATPLPPEDFTSESCYDYRPMPDIPATMQEEWYKDKACIVEVDPDIQNSIKEIEDLTKDLQLDVADDEDAFRELRSELHLDRNSVSDGASHFRNHQKIFGDKLFSTTGFEQRRYPRTSSRERSPTRMVPRRASVPRVNATRVTYRKPTSHTRKSGLLSSGPQTFRAVANVAHLKSPKSFLEELRSSRARVLHNNLMRASEHSGAYSNGCEDPHNDTHDDLDLDKFLRANSQHGSAGSSGSRLSMLSTPESRLESPQANSTTATVRNPLQSSLRNTTIPSSRTKPDSERNFGPAYDDADELILKDIEQEFF